VTRSAAVSGARSGTKKGALASISVPVSESRTATIWGQDPERASAAMLQLLLEHQGCGREDGNERVAAKTTDKLPLAQGERLLRYGKGS
jgi:hypothetical protein